MPQAQRQGCLLYTSNHVLESFKEKCFRIAAVEPKSHFFKVGGKMLRRNFVPRTDDATLEQAKGGLDAIRGDIAVNIDLRTMVDRLVFHSGLTSTVEGERVDTSLIRHNHFHILADIVLDVFRQRPGLHVLCFEKAKIAAALFDTEYRNLRLFCGIDTLPDFLAAEIGFIHLNRSIHHQFLGRSHRRANSVAEIPRRLVGLSLIHI